MNIQQSSASSYAQNKICKYWLIKCRHSAVTPLAEHQGVQDSDTEIYKGLFTDNYWDPAMTHRKDTEYKI